MAKWDHLLEADAAMSRALQQLRASPTDVDLWGKTIALTKRRGLLLVAWVHLRNVWLPRVVVDARLAGTGPGKTVSSPGALEIQTMQFQGWGPFEHVLGKDYLIGTARKVGASYEAVDDAGLSTMKTTSGRTVGMSPRTMMWAGRHGKKKDENLEESDVRVRQLYRRLITDPADEQNWIALLREARRNRFALGWTADRFRTLRGMANFSVVTDVIHHTKEDYPDLDTFHLDGVWAVHYQGTGNDDRWIVLPVIADYVRRRVIVPSVRNAQGDVVT